MNNKNAGQKKIIVGEKDTPGNNKNNRNKESNQGNQKTKITLKLSFTNIGGLCSNFVDCKSFLESNSPDILALCEKSG